MISALAGRKLPFFLVLLCFVLAGALTYQRVAPSEPWTVPTAAARAEAAPAAVETDPEKALANSEKFAAIGAQTIFRPMRRPPAPVKPTDQPPAPVAPAPFPALSLVGMVGGPDHRSILLQRPGMGATLFLREGDTVDGWSLVDIGADRALFGHDTQRQELTFPPHDSARSTSAVTFGGASSSPR